VENTEGCIMAKVTQKDRDKTGMKKEGAEGKYPMSTEAQCLSAVRLRHNGKGVSAAEVLAKASRAANSHNWERCKAKIKEARETDSKRNK
jgi:hypothetical protein